MKMSKSDSDVLSVSSSEEVIESSAPDDIVGNDGNKCLCDTEGKYKRILYFYIHIGGLYVYDLRAKRVSYYWCHGCFKPLGSSLRLVTKHSKSLRTFMRVQK